MYRRSPAESGYLLYYPQFAGICQAGSDDFVSCLFPVCFLFFCKSSTGRLSAVAGTAALDIHMICHALVIAVINTFYRLTVDADRMAWMRQGITERFSSLSLLRKALTAGAVTVTGVLAAHHDVSLAAQTVLIIGTIFHNTF